MYYTGYYIDDCTDVYWSPRDILQVSMGHNWENIFIGLFHVSGHSDHFGRHLFFGKKIILVEWVDPRPPPPWKIPPNLSFFFHLTRPLGLGQTKQAGLHFSVQLGSNLYLFYNTKWWRVKDEGWKMDGKGCRVND